MAEQIYNSILETIGNTPLVRLNRIGKGCHAEIVAKVESFNPGGSVKDRIGICMIEQAEREGKLKPGGTIVEPTSGNTGVSLAIVACLKGYDLVFTMPDKMSMEKRRLLRAYGGRVIICPTAVDPDDPRSYYRVADQLTKEIPGAFQPNQYQNPANPLAHYETTGPEIWEQTEGKIDLFIAGMGTGGTITGVARYLKKRNPNIKVVGADPEGSLFYGRFYNKEEIVHPYSVQGIGEDFMPDTLEMDLVDEVVQVNDRDSLLMARRIVREEGILAGGSAGTVLVAAVRVAQRAENKGRRIVVIFPDSGDRYLSNLFSDEWMIEKGFLAGATEGARARDILNTKKQVPTLVSLSPADRIEKAIKLMEEHGISQIPVLEGEQCVGSITEIGVMNNLLMDPTFKERKTGEVMDPAFPIVAPTAPLSEVVNLVETHPAVLVKEKKIEGIITKMDIIEGLR